MEVVTNFSTIIESAVALENSFYERHFSLPSMKYIPDVGDFGGFEKDGETFVLDADSTRQVAASMPSFSFGMFSKASPELRRSMMTEFLSYANDSERKFLIRDQGVEGEGLFVLRGVVPAEHESIQDSMLYSILNEVAEDFSEVVLCNSHELSDPKITRLRVVNPAPIDDDDDLFLALDLTTSTRGYSPIVLRYCLYRQVSSAGLMIPVQDTGHYFSIDYSSLQREDFELVVSNAAVRFRECNEEVMQGVRDLTAQRMKKAEVERFYRTLQSVPGSGKGIAQKAFAIANEAGITSKWDILNTITRAAQSYRDELRLRYELVAGRYWNDAIKMEIVS